MRPPVPALALVAACLALPQPPDWIPAFESFVEREMKDKQIPAIAIALVEGDRTIYRRAFGEASEESVFRVGSVSKLYTAIALMQFVEQGTVELDAPVSRYLPEFQPENPFHSKVTLRQLLSHRSGLTREPPVGHYFDAASPGLEATVASLNSTTLVYPPEVRTKYSNAGVAVAGAVVEKLAGKPFARHLRDAVLEPLGMTSSSFALTPEIRSRVPRAIMWTYDGRVFDAPVWEFGMAPAANLYSTVGDQAKFLAAMLAGGAPVLRNGTLETMLKPQFGGSFGVGFSLSKWDERRTAGHGGAVYGFATSWRFLPDDRLGAVAVATKDCANSVVDRINQQALGCLLALRQDRACSFPPASTPVGPARARQLEGRYGTGEKTLELSARGPNLYLLPGRGGQRLRVRMSGPDLFIDDILSHGKKIGFNAEALLFDGERLLRQPQRKPEPPRLEWRELIGEYGWDFNTLYILERGGRLNALIEWFDYYPLEELGKGLYRFPAWGLYDNERLTFQYDNSGNVTGVGINGVVFPHRRVEPLRIRPPKPIGTLRNEARKARPPAEKGRFLKSDLVDLPALDRSIRLDIRYASEKNFLGAAVYPKARALLQRPAAQALLRAHRSLLAEGYGLLIHDAYRPWYITKLFWDATPPGKRIFVADPAKGSRHNRGCAVDLTLYELGSGKPVEMPGFYDEMSARSYPDYPGGTASQRWLRDLLRRAMEANGFEVFETEWWHFDYRDWPKYAILNLPIERLGRGK